MWSRWVDVDVENVAARRSLIRPRKACCHWREGITRQTKGSDHVEVESFEFVLCIVDSPRVDVVARRSEHRRDRILRFGGNDYHAGYL
jgi:hypothetical protein